MQVAGRLDLGRIPPAAGDHRPAASACQIVSYSLQATDCRVVRAPGTRASSIRPTDIRGLTAESGKPETRDARTLRASCEHTDRRSTETACVPR